MAVYVYVEVDGVNVMIRAACICVLPALCLLTSDRISMAGYQHKTLVLYGRWTPDGCIDLDTR